MRSKFELTTIEEKQFYEDVKKILLEAREHAYSNASAIMTQVYWNIGKRIIEQEQNRESHVWPGIADSSIFHHTGDCILYYDRRRGVPGGDGTPGRDRG